MEDIMTASSDSASSAGLLRRTLWGNAVFSVVSGAVLATFASSLASAATLAPVSVAGLELTMVYYSIILLPLH